MDYGISKRKGKPLRGEVEEILKYASGHGLDTLDTAPSYGDSETVIGQALSEQHQFRIYTKTPVYKRSTIVHDDAERLRSVFIKSLRRLGQKKIEGLLIHNPDDLLAEQGELLFAAMVEIRKDGLANKIGVSVYTGEQIRLLLQRYDFDVIQLPLNVLDRRLMHDDQLKALKDRGIEIHARSIFLQGLLLMNPDTLHPFFEPLKPILRKYHTFLRERGLTPVEGSFCLIKHITEIDRVIIGVNNREQLEANLNAMRKSYNDDLYDGLKAFSINDHLYLNPSLWQIH